MIDNNDPELARLGRALMGERTTPPRAGLDAMAQEIDGRLAEIEQALDAMTRQGMTPGDPRLSRLTQGADTLRALRERIGAGGADFTPAQLRSQLAEALRLTDGVAQGAIAGAAASGDWRTTRIVAQAEYQATMTRIERDMDTLMRTSESAFNDTLRQATAAGIATDDYEDAYGFLRDRAEQRRKQGDRVGAMGDDALAVHVDATLARDLADTTGDPDHAAAADERERDAAKARSMYLTAVEAEARLAATQRGMDPQAAEAFVAQTVAGRTEAFDGMADAISSASSEKRSIFQTVRDATLSPDLGMAQSPTMVEAHKTLQEEWGATATMIESRGMGEEGVAWAAPVALHSGSASVSAPAFAQAAATALPTTPLAAPIEVAEVAPPTPLPQSGGSGGRVPI